MRSDRRGSGRRPAARLSEKPAVMPFDRFGDSFSVSRRTQAFPAASIRWVKLRKGAKLPSESTRRLSGKRVALEISGARMVFRSERRLRRRNLFWGEVRKGGKAPLRAC